MRQEESDAMSIEDSARRNRKGSMDARANNEFGSHPDYIMGKKRKSQDERANELMKSRSQFMKQIPSNLLSEDKKLRN